MEQDLFTTASQLLAAGYSVIPIEEGEKRPMIAWREYQKRLATPEELDKWFNSSGANIAIVTGRISHLVVVDVDPRNGGDTIIDGYSLGRATVLTGGGGYHYYYSYNPLFEGCSPSLWKGVDIKSDGGYILVPPSITTGEYRYTPNEPFPPERRAPPAMLMTKYLDQKTKTQEFRVNHFVTKNALGQRVRVTLKDVPEGGRNNHAAKLYGALLYEGIGPLAAGEILALWNSCLSKPLPPEEISAVITSISARHVRHKGDREEVKKE